MNLKRIILYNFFYIQTTLQFAAPPKENTEKNTVKLISGTLQLSAPSKENHAKHNKVLPQRISLPALAFKFARPPSHSLVRPRPRTRLPSKRECKVQHA